MELSLYIFFGGGIFKVTFLSSKCFEKNITIWLYQTRLHHGRFPKYILIFFQDSYFTKQL